MTDLQRRALALHRAEVIRLGPCPELGECCGGECYLPLCHDGLDLSDGGILLACVEAEVQVWRYHPLVIEDRPLPWFATVYRDARVVGEMDGGTPTEAAVAALEAAR